MKKILYLIAIGILFIGASILTSCTKEGPIGPAGPNGTNGTNGTDGKDANASCLVCHTSSNMDSKLAEYKLSKHYFGTSSGRNTKFCARCHTSEGFQQILANGIYVVSNDMPTANRINCETCHAHSAFDFTGDTVSMILRTTTPVPLNYYEVSTATNFFNNSKTQDFGKINNLCCTCHQIRGATSTVYSDTVARPQILNKAFEQLPYFPFTNTDDNADVNYLVGRSFAVHDGNQSNLFTGINGYEYVGKTYTRTWRHSTNTCTDCHMNKFDPTTKTGGHSLIPNEAECTKCHGSDKIKPVQDLTTAKLTELAELLSTRKVFKKTVNTSGVASYAAQPTHDFNGKLYLTTSSNELYATSSSNNTVSTTTGLVVYGNILKYAKDTDYANRIGRPWKMGELGAAYNYAYINSELSLGVHNPVYATQLLQNSIDWLKAHPAK